MRIQLAKGKQRKLIESAKKERTWEELSRELGLSEGYIRNELRNEKTLLSDFVYKKACSLTNQNYESFVVYKLKDDWGRSKGGKLSSGSTKNINVPLETEELSEFYGIMLGDGNLTKMKAHKVGTYQIRIVGDSRNDRDYLINYVKPLIEKLFNVKTGIFKIKNENAICLSVHSRKLVEFLEEKEFKPGDKIKNQLGIPDWIKKDKKLLCACLRGLYDTDGEIYKLNEQNSFQVVFTNYNERLINDVRKALQDLGIIPSRIYNGKRLFITKKSELGKFLKHIGFSNFKNLAKIKTWNL